MATATLAHIFAVGQVTLRLLLSGAQIRFLPLEVDGMGRTGRGERHLRETLNIQQQQRIATILDTGVSKMPSDCFSYNKRRRQHWHLMDVCDDDDDDGVHQFY